MAVGIVVGVLSGCTMFGDEDQKNAVRATFEALPRDVTEALDAGKVRLAVYGETASNVGASREIVLSLPDALPTTLGSWVAGCRAAVAALAPTSARLYGHLPDDPFDDPQLHEGTDELCLAGLGHPLVRPIDEAVDGSGGLPQPALLIGIRSGDVVTDTAINLDPSASVIETKGYEWRPRGVRILLAPPGAADRPLVTQRLPWRMTEDSGRATFIVPSGSRLRVQAVCTRRDPAAHIRLDPRPEGNYVTFGGGAPEQMGDDGKQMESCLSLLSRDLTPQLTYRDQMGRLVDRYGVTAFVSSMTGEESDPDVRVEQLPRP